MGDGSFEIVQYSTKVIQKYKKRIVRKAMFLSLQKQIVKRWYHVKRWAADSIIDISTYSYGRITNHFENNMSGSYNFFSCCNLG